VYVEEAEMIYLLLLYGKDEQTDLTSDQKRELGKVIKRIKDGFKRKL